MSTLAWRAILASYEVSSRDGQSLPSWERISRKPRVVPLLRRVGPHHTWSVIGWVSSLYRSTSGELRAAGTVVLRCDLPTSGDRPTLVLDEHDTLKCVYVNADGDPPWECARFDD